MNLQSLKNENGARKRKTRVGRGAGSGMGKTSGRGHKGQYAREGHKHKAGFEGGQMRLVRRLPKRGFKNFTRKVYAPVNIESLKCFESGSEVTAVALRACGLVRGRWDGVKILGSGELDRSLKVIANAFSGAAKSKIEAAGGTCEVVS